MGFTEVPQEPCVMKRGGIICFFYVDDIVFAFRKKDAEHVTGAKHVTGAEHVTGAVTEMRKHFKLNEIGEMK